ncbi:hypothetical protein BDR03DRAFT_1036502 [Suillus americanus]|nr:hypothetical protein BDR03DRAFT_1036502 [Suillus americanus]
MAAQLSTPANEVARVSLEVSMEGILDNVNFMAMNLTNRVRSLAEVTKAVAGGDLTKSTCEGSLSLFADEVGTEGRLGGRARLTSVGGTREDLTDNVNVMAANTAVARGDLTRRITGTELANRNKSEFLANISHEIKQHYSSFSSQYSALNLTLDSDLNRSQRGSLLLVHSLARPLLLIIDDILDISKIFGILKDPKLDLTYDVDQDVPDQLIGDSLQLLHTAPMLANPQGSSALLPELYTVHDHSSNHWIGWGESTNPGLIPAQASQPQFASLNEAFSQNQYGADGSDNFISEMFTGPFIGLAYRPRRSSSEVSKGSKFFFTITSQIFSKMQPFHRRAILFVDTLNATTGIIQRIQELGLRSYIIHDVSEVADKERCPHIDTIVVDSLSMTGCIRQYEHLRCIPIVLLAPSMPRLIKRCLDNSISSQVTIPVATQDLASALISSLESNTVSPCGHTVEIAENGSLVVEASNARGRVNEPFDIILMDVSMPFMGGMEPSELIRAYGTKNSYEFLSHATMVPEAYHQVVDQVDKVLVVEVATCC